MSIKAKGQKGQSAVEYGIVALIIVSIIVLAMRTPLNNAISSVFTKMNNKAQNAS
jgi:Flp pilus assembly pilin Flp